MGVAERRDREREARRSAVLEAARGLVRERGLSGTSSRGIAERCELSEGTVFFYFKNKEEIFVSLLFEGIAFMREGLERIGASRPGGRRLIERIWRWFGEVQAQHPEYMQVFAYLAQPGAIEAVRPEIREELGRRSGENFKLFQSIIEAAMDAGELRRLPARQVADLLWGGFFGMSQLASSRASLGAPARPDDRDLKSALGFLLGGLKAEAGRGGPS